MQAPSTIPPAPAPRPGQGLGDRLWSRKLLLALLVAAVTFALGAQLFAKLQSEIGPGRTTFAVHVTPRGGGGDFDAITTARGERSSVATCTVTAFDIYGDAVGAKGFDLGWLAPGEPHEWSGHVRAEVRVERMSIDCR